MVAGHLEVKKGYYYVVLSYHDSLGKRKLKWISTGLAEKGNKRKAEMELTRIRNEFEPPSEGEDLSADMSFADYLEQWLEIVKVRIKIATYSSYSGMVKSTIAPYFRKKKITLKGLEARHMIRYNKLRKLKIQ